MLKAYKLNVCGLFFVFRGLSKNINMNNILVTRATEHLGSAVIETLLKKIPSNQKSGRTTRDHIRFLNLSRKQYHF